MANKANLTGESIKSFTDMMQGFCDTILNDLKLISESCKNALAPSTLGNTNAEMQALFLEMGETADTYANTIKVLVETMIADVVRRSALLTTSNEEQAKHINSIDQAVTNLSQGAKNIASKYTA